MELKQSVKPTTKNPIKDGLSQNNIPVELGTVLRKKDAVERGHWANKTEFILSCMGYAIGIGNVWRFPYLAYRNGGGAFLVPYVIMLVACGIPLFFMETIIGQFCSLGCVKFFYISPIFKGAGLAMIYVNVIVTIYYNVLICYPLYFMVKSFTAELPWNNCDNSWNTEKCIHLQDSDLSSHNMTDLISMGWKTPADEFFHNNVLQISSSIEEQGSLVWHLVIADAFSWTIVFLCLAKGIQSVGKVVYFTATFPFIILFILLIRGLTLPGAWEGVVFYVYPEWAELLNLRVWADAAAQIFFSLGPGWGGIVNMASFNKFSNNTKLDSIIVPTINVLTSIAAGFVVFTVLGYMSFKTGIPIKDVATGGPGLAFVTYPEALSMMPLSQLWSVLFFLMLYILGIDSLFVQIEAIISGISDEFPKLRGRKILTTFVTLFLMFIISLIFTTNAGMYNLQLADWYTAPMTVILICFLEVILVSFIYGVDNFIRDTEFMIQRKIGYYWKLMWKYVTPLVLAFILTTVVAFNTAVTYNGIKYPVYTVVFGWLLALSSMLFIPLYMVYYLIFQESGTFKERLRASAAPSPNWGPKDPEDRAGWEACKANRQATR